MKREDFMQIIKLRSFYKIDKRKGNFELLNGKKLSDYVRNLVETQMKIDNLGITKTGDLAPIMYGGNWNIGTKEFDDYTLAPDFKDEETCKFDDMEKRISNLVWDIIGKR